jgi:hypothetical protein
VLLAQVRVGDVSTSFGTVGGGVLLLSSSEILCCEGGSSFAFFVPNSETGSGTMTSSCLLFSLLQ